MTAKLPDSNLIVQPGTAVGEMIPQLLRLTPEITKVTFVAYRPAPTLDKRLEGQVDPFSEERAEADRLHREFGIPFWDAVLAIGIKRGKVPESYVDISMLHDSAPDEQVIEFDCNQASANRINSLQTSLPIGFGLAISSRVELAEGGTAHIPMMDFRCQFSESNTVTVKRALAAMGERQGVLVNSGRSYHFYGFGVRTAEQWVKFMAFGALFSPIVDVRYIAHRLIDGTCRLRISSAPGKENVPVVIEAF